MADFLFAPLPDGMSLAFHIILAAVGTGLPLIMAIAALNQFSKNA